ncbi:MAG: UDP-3-O-(3-hydroxymyristoyl)glucosamine N-acyltransferase [Akkermansiaceae bacterium]|nr:UDP-3-O-(3-hydroxymyristoyl)glucosamine N-acyltransferase [Akkermansiaceae bacterium]
MAFVLTLSELAKWIDGNIVRGELDLPLAGMAALDRAGPQDVSFLGNEKYYHQFLETKAAAVIVPRNVTTGPPGTALIAVENPSLSFAVVVRHFAAATRKFIPGIHPHAFVDPSAVINSETVRVAAGAVISAGAKVGDGSDIGPNSVILEDVVIGKNCIIMANASIRERCILGDRVVLQPGVVIGSDGYGYEFSEGRHVKIDQVGIVEIHDDVEIGANTTVDRARFGKTIIGEGTKIDNLVQIGHNCEIGKHCLIVAHTGISGSSKLLDYVTIGGQAGVAGHVTIGEKAMIAARSGVTTNLPGNIIYAGKPAVPIKEEMKSQAHVRRLPKLIERVKALEIALHISNK